MDMDIRTEAAHIAAALKAALSVDAGLVPEIAGIRPAAIPLPKSTPASAVRTLPATNERPAESPGRVPSTPDSSPAGAAFVPPAPERPASAGTGPAATDETLILPSDLGSLREVVAECTRCRLHRTRQNTVFGEGPVNPTLMVIGEGAGPAEDETGRPFAGEAGKLLSAIIKAMGLDRDADCYVATILKCIIPDGSTPTPEIIGSCRPYVARQIELVRPGFLLAMGQTAAATLAGSPSIMRLRGRLLMYDQARNGGADSGAPAIPMVVTYHPAALLKDPTLKKQVWQDVQIIMEQMKQNT